MRPRALRNRAPSRHDSPARSPVNLYFRLLLVLFGQRFRRGLNIHETDTTIFRVTVGDLDVYGHMNNGRYLTIMDLGRLRWLRRTGIFDRTRAEGWAAVVAQQTVTYRRPLRVGQRFELRTRYLGSDDHGSYTEQTFVRRGNLHAHAVVRTKFLTRHDGPVVTDDLRALLDGDDLVVPDWVADWSASARSAAADSPS